MKVYAVKIEYYGLVAAKEEAEVPRYVREIVKNEEPQVDIERITRLDQTTWDRGAIPYGDNPDELDLEEIFKPRKIEVEVPGAALDEVWEYLRKRGCKVS